jgi:putative MATE family efflux protein
MAGAGGERPRSGSGLSTTNRRIVALAVPAMGALVADPILGLVDTAVAGRLGAEALGALGIGVAVLATVSWVFNFLVYGTTAAVARTVGGGDHRTAGRRVAHAAWAAVALGVVAGIVVAVGARPVLAAMGAVPEVVEPAVVYLRVRAVGIVALLLTYVGHGAFRGVSDTRTPLAIAVAGNLLNAALDVVLVFGFGMGLAGIAWATVVAEFAMAAAFVALIRRAGLPLLGHGRPDRAEVTALVVVSRDLFLRTGALVAGLLAVTAAAARIGTVTVAAHQVIWQVWVLVSFVMDGFAIAAQAMVGTALGARRTEEARETAAVLVRWGTVGGLVAAVLLLALGGWGPRLLTDDAAVLAAVGAAWWLAMGGHAVNGLVFVLDGVFMGAGDFAYLRTWALVGAAAAAAIAQVAATAGADLVWMWVAIQTMMLIRLGSLLARLRGRVWLRVGVD